MIPEKVEHSIINYFCHSADIEALDLLNDWISIEENQIVFKEFVMTNYAINLAMNDPNLENIKKQLIQEIRKEKNPLYRHRMAILKYAAIAIVCLSIGFMIQISFKNIDTSPGIIPKNDAITLDLGNGDIEVINEHGETKVLNSRGEIVGKKSGNKLIYNQGNHETKLTYNTLHIPHGKQFSIILSDGSLVHLNSGSTITYPVKFIKDSIRWVSLRGEAYFEVVHNKDQPFIVNSEELDIQVYGTSFNVSNYPEAPDTEVVLVEGSVSLTNTNQKEAVFLTPGFKGSFNKKNKEIIDAQVNTNLYTSWMQGNLVFRNTPFDHITQKLERAYNVIIINNNENLAKETFNATIETKHESIEQVLNYFNKVYQIEYVIIENKIVIN